MHYAGLLFCLGYSHKNLMLVSQNRKNGRYLHISDDNLEEVVEYKKKIMLVWIFILAK